MRKTARLFAIVIALIMLMCYGATATYANEETPVDYENLFAKASEVDGYLTEIYSIELADAFDQDPIAFISALGNENSTVVDNISFLLAVEFQFRDCDSYQALLTTLQMEAGMQEKNIVLGILSHMDDLSSSSDNTTDLDSYIFPDNTFNPDVVEKYIIAGLGNTGVRNAEFCSYVSMLYQISPTHFDDILSAMTYEDISYIGECIAYDLSLKGITPASITSTSSTSLDILQNQIQSSLQSDDLTGDIVYSTLEETNQIAPMTSASLPTSVEIYYLHDRDYPYVGDTVRIAVSMDVNKSISSLVIFHVELYQRINGVYQMISSGNAAATPGSLNATIQFPKTFFDRGQKGLRAKIYDSSGTNLLATVDSNELFIVGRWSIRVDLPENRHTLGRLSLYDPYGVGKCTDICLGASAENLPASQINGHTPEGVYTGYLYGPVAPYESYGQYKVINMTGVSGDIAEYSYRSGIWIHGGRDGLTNPYNSNCPLYPTYGCVRITSAYQKQLQDIITGWLSKYEYLSAEGDITITEYETV